MDCYDCGHPVHGANPCIECDCPDWRASERRDAVLRERPPKLTPEQYDELT